MVMFRIRFDGTIDEKLVEDIPLSIRSSDFDQLISNRNEPLDCITILFPSVTEDSIEKLAHVVFACNRYVVPVGFQAADQFLSFVPPTGAKTCKHEMRVVETENVVSEMWLH